MKHQVNAEIALKVADWITNKKGARVWEDLMIGRQVEMMSPAANDNGELYPSDHKPHHTCGRILRTLKSLDDVEVVIGREVDRLRVGLRHANNSTAIKLDDPSLEKLQELREEWAPAYCLSTTCGWQGHQKDFVERTQKTLASAYIYDACPKCGCGDLAMDDNAGYQFDYDNQEAVIIVIDKKVPLRDFIKLGETLCSDAKP